MDFIDEGVSIGLEVKSKTGERARPQLSQTLATWPSPWLM